MPSAEPPAHYQLVLRHFQRLETEIKSALAQDISPDSQSIAPLPTMRRWQEDLRSTGRDLRRHLHRFSATILISSSKAGVNPAQVQWAIIDLEQRIKKLLNLRYAAKRLQVPPQLARGQELLISAIKAILTKVQDIFSFFNQAMTSPEAATMVWQEGLLAAPEIRSCRLWFQGQKDPSRAWGPGWLQPVTTLFPLQPILARAGLY
ncbi:MAG: hypothetical protein ABFR97_04785 [Thermodesulfobacteriota bacterium]